MKEINIENQTKNSLEFIFNEANKHFTEILNSVNRNINRSFVLLGIYITLITFSFSKIITQDYEYIVLLVGGVISILFIRRNIFPNNREIIGASPSRFFLEYFDSFKGEGLEKEYLISTILSYEDSMDINKTLITKMVKRYKNSIYCFILFLVVFFILFAYVCTQSC
ncbi:hypothetical protein [Tenacibaculum salmonis]|uniref:hypothetical protein n=1 Tax=Tenacibaculum sp. P3-BQ1 TaxID=3232310 RepID=UPI0034DFB892